MQLWKDFRLLIETKINIMKKILIIGDAGRGKTTFAKKLSEKLNIPKYSLDDFFWEIKFTKPRGKEKDVEMAREVFEKDEWIVEGGTRRMLILGLPKADQIFYLTYKNIFQQIWALYKRNRSKDNENLKNLFKLIVYQIKKKYKLGKHKHIESFDEMLEPYKYKVVRMKSFEEIDECLDKI